MTKRRLRYSDLGAPTAKPVPGGTPEPVAPVVVSGKPRRTSSPVDVARALAKERSVEHFTEPHAPAEVPGRTMRERTRARSGVVDLLMFRIGEERFAVELLAVDEVIDLPVIHHVPEMPNAMLGVVTVRGSLTPVYSPHHALGVSLAIREGVLIFRRGSARVGVLIDDVDDAISIDLREVRDAPGANEADNVVLGVIRYADALVGIVDADALIAACQTAALLEIA
jgi:purine-binding chemotaxis protein CheW